MAIAGKVAITLSTENGGAWSADVTYDRLVAVKHNNNLYISRKTVANVEPPNNEFWFLALEGFGGDDVESILQAIENIINGTTQVGNAKTLDGHGAEYFVDRGKTLTTSILEKALTLVNGLHNFILAGGSYTGGDLPLNAHAYSSASVLKRANNAILVILWGDSNSRFSSNWYNGVEWSGWKTYTTEADLANYLPLTGGKLSKNNVVPLEIESTASNNTRVLIDFLINGTEYGHLGFDGVDNPVFRSIGNATYNKLLHTGNKPTGSYTGNGDATERVIETGGIVNTALVYSTIGTAILTTSGCTIITSSGNVSWLQDALIRENQGIVLRTTNSVVNSSGATLRYKVL